MMQKQSQDASTSTCTFCTFQVQSICTCTCLNVLVLILVLGLKYLYLTFSRHLKLSFSQTERFRTVVSKYFHNRTKLFHLQEYFSLKRAKLFCFWECTTVIGYFLFRGRITVQQLDKSYIFTTIPTLITQTDSSTSISNQVHSSKYKYLYLYFVYLYLSYLCAEVLLLYKRKISRCIQ